MYSSINQFDDILWEILEGNYRNFFNPYMNQDDNESTLKVFHYILIGYINDFFETNLFLKEIINRQRKKRNVMGEESQSRQSSSLVQNSSLSFNCSNDQKYGGLIEISLIEKTQKQPNDLFNYLYFVTPPYIILHHILTVFNYYSIVYFIGDFFPLENVYLTKIHSLMIFSISLMKEVQGMK
ncbi:hypothetical protein TRFO_28511 [Tritrichomonas foetus]|uniref:Uncharacterized protein n=1 Tax=Tritrichomonas foetus TaxID=1144522 RepID=A0A1J4JZF2_9EUKA|nr:hypothetical protein TRFO_28511 [Tritrichomonas foetus]|eukprot:OHT04066.1 hypothetical protein TRFO_28511 [Tritrichomonas foetus]